MNLVIFVGGPTACGKSTFTNKLNENLTNSKKYRRYQGFFDIGTLKGISKQEIFKQITSKDVDDWFINVCKEKEIIISDVHYAVQMNRNVIKQELEVDIYQDYVPTISQDLLNKLLLADIKVVAIYLSCSSEICYDRAIIRFNNSEKELRTQSLHDAELESSAEKKAWNNILSNDSVIGIELNSELYSSEELVDQCLIFLKKEFKLDESYQLIKKKIDCR